MKRRLVFHSLPLLAVFLALAPTALASTKWYVDGVHGSDNNNCKSRQHACKTIGHAISLASSGDSITVAAATYTENLTIGVSLRIVGSGTAMTIIDGGGVNTVVAVHSGDVTLSNVTIRNGLASPEGGGIYNEGAILTINNSTISANQVIFDRFLPPLGGGIYNNGSLTINNSTISGNTAKGRLGHAARGGGIYNEDYATLTINNSTISANQASGVGGFAGGIANGTYVGGTATFQNSIVANNSGGNCAGTMTSNGYNLSSDSTCNFNSTGDLSNTDPKLGPLQNNGGPTQTQALLAGSPAIDEGNPSGCTDSQGHLLKTDQRGKPRPDKEDTSGCDMGAYERQKD
jgi:hypothetical protein